MIAERARSAQPLVPRRNVIMSTKAAELDARIAAALVSGRRTECVRGCATVGAQKGLTEEAQRLRDFGPPKSVIRNLGANDVHKHLRLQRLKRIHFLVDQKTRLVLLHDKTTTAVADLRRSIDHVRRDMLQSRSVFSHKSSQLEIVRHKLALSLEAANAADTERVAAHAERIKAIEVEEREKEVRAMRREAGACSSVLLCRSTNRPSSSWTARSLGLCTPSQSARRLQSDAKRRNS
jgi:hypothetical protein